MVCIVMAAAMSNYVYAVDDNEVKTLEDFLNNDAFTQIEDKAGAAVAQAKLASRLKNVCDRLHQKIKTTHEKLNLDN